MKLDSVDHSALENILKSANYWIDIVLQWKQLCSRFLCSLISALYLFLSFENPSSYARTILTNLKHTCQTLNLSESKWFTLYTPCHLWQQSDGLNKVSKVQMVSCQLQNSHLSLAMKRAALKGEENNNDAPGTGPRTISEGLAVNDSNCYFSSRSLFSLLTQYYWCWSR